MVDTYGSDTIGTGIIGGNTASIPWREPKRPCNGQSGGITGSSELESD